MKRSKPKKSNGINKSIHFGKNNTVELGSAQLFLNPLQSETKCELCDGVEDEHLILLCDGHSCKNEFHMFCLLPILTRVPDDAWLCPSCDPIGTTKSLQGYLSEHDQHCEASRALYENKIPCEFEISSDQILGMYLTIHLTNDNECHSGRIISNRRNEFYGCIEHLIQFKRFD